MVNERSCQESTTQVLPHRKKQCMGVGNSISGIYKVPAASEQPCGRADQDDEQSPFAHVNVQNDTFKTFSPHKSFLSYAYLAPLPCDFSQHPAPVPCILRL